MSIHPHTFIEEIMLLALDDTTGALRPMPPMALGYALAGALLADLALHDRTDTDAKQLTVLDPTPTGDALLDRALATIVASPAPQPVAHWLSVFSEERHLLENAALERLVANRILQKQEKKFLWVFGVRRYPTVDNTERTEVRTRLAALILGQDLPDPRDAILLSLLSACRLTQRIFPGPEFTARSERLATLAKMDLVGREVGSAIEEINRAMNSVVHLGM